MVVVGWCGGVRFIRSTGTVHSSSLCGIIAPPFYILYYSISWQVLTFLCSQLSSLPHRCTSSKGGPKITMGPQNVNILGPLGAPFSRGPQNFMTPVASIALLWEKVGVQWLRHRHRESGNKEKRHRDRLPCGYVYRSSHWIGKSVSYLRPCCRLSMIVQVFNSRVVFELTHDGWWHI